MTDQLNAVVFRGTILKQCDICRPKKGGVYIRCHFTSELTTPVMEAMGWASLPDCLEGARLTGVIISPQHFVLTPHAPELSDYEIQLECAEVADFNIQRIEKKDDSVRTELRFVVRTNEDGAETSLANWMRKLGPAEAALKVVYAGNIQPRLPMETGEETEAEAEDEGPQAEPAIDGPREAPLAQAAVMGGTHAKRGRGRPARNRAAEAVADGSGETDCVDCNNQVPFLDGDNTMHASGQPCRVSQ